MKKNILFLYSLLNCGYCFSQTYSISVSPLNLAASAAQNFYVSGKSVSRTGQKEFYIQIYNSCYGTNLRSVANPLAPNSTVTANITLISKSAGKVVPISRSINYPAALVTRGGLGGTTNLNNLNKSAGLSNVSASGNLVRTQVPITTTYTVTTDGNIDFTNDVEVQSLSFSQSFAAPPSPKVCTANPTVECCVTDPETWWGYSFPNPALYPGYEYSWDGGIAWNWSERSAHQSYCIEVSMAQYRGAYMGYSGGLSGGWSYALASDKKTLEIFASFPGENGFCGGYFSPLMFIFGDKTPTFEGMSYFPLNKTGITYWPEAGADAGFLVYDKNGDGKITLASELFGDNIESSKPYENGFEKLKEFDSNKDGKINKKDKLFGKLAAWVDKDGDGISKENEIKTLKSLGILEISLAYTHKGVTAVADRAELREQSQFTMQIKGKKVTKKIIDVYLAPGIPSQPNIAEVKK